MPRNLFEATASGDAAGLVTVDAQGLGAFSLPCAHQPHGMRTDALGVAIRPEKLSLHESAPDLRDGAVVAFEATVSQTAYHGSESRTYLETDQGARFVVSEQNRSRDSARLERGTRRWVSWAASDTLLLDR